MKLNQTSFDDAIYGAEEEIAFQIDDSNSVIFDILRDKMYSDKIGSICREIISNSRDANREAGRGHLPVQIEIIDPNELLFVSDLSISFNDKGPGITPERVGEVFVKYGASTKRETNSQTGGFGLGAKTPFAYTDTFTIITVCKIDGQTMEYIYTAMIDSSRKGKLVRFDSYPVDKPTGTKIIIPIKEEDRREFETKSIKATLLWGKNIEYINFMTPVQPLETIIDEERYAVHKDPGQALSRLSDGYILSIDGIPYPINRGAVGIQDAGLTYKYLIEIKAEIGELTISANREAIQYDQSIIDTINEVRETIGIRLTKKVSDYLNSAPRFIEACWRRLSLSNERVHDKVAGSAAVDAIDKMINDVAFDGNTLINTAFKRLTNIKGVTYKGVQLIDKIKLQHHKLLWVAFDHSKERWTYDDFTNEKVSDNWLKVVHYMDARKDARRNETIRQTMNSDSFLMINPDYDATKPTKEQSDELFKLMMTYDINVFPYSEVEKAEEAKGGYKRYIKKDVIDIESKELGVYSHGSFWTKATTIKYERNTKTHDLATTEVLLKVPSLQTRVLEYEITEKMLHQISIVKHCMPKVRFLLVNKQSVERYLADENYDRLQGLYDTCMQTHMNELQEIKMLQTVVDKIGNYDKYNISKRVIDRFVINHIPEVMVKSLRDLFEKYPSLKNGQVPTNEIFWRNFTSNSKYDLVNAIKKSNANIDKNFPMLKSFIALSEEKLPIKKKIAEDYVKMMSEVLSKR